MPLILYGKYSFPEDVLNVWETDYPAVHSTVGTTAVLISILIVDKFGRRTLFCM